MIAYVFDAYLVCVSMTVQNNMRISRTRVQVVETLQYLLGANLSKNAYFSNFLCFALNCGGTPLSYKNRPENE